MTGVPKTIAQLLGAARLKRTPALRTPVATERCFPRGRLSSSTSPDEPAAGNAGGRRDRDVHRDLARTERLGEFYRTSAAELYADFDEPWLTYSRELVEWFQRMEIPDLRHGLIANEVPYHPGPGSSCRCTAP